MVPVADEFVIPVHLQGKEIYWSDLKNSDLESDWYVYFSPCASFLCQLNFPVK